MAEGDPGAAASAGALLRAARERQGLHIAALAAAIKVTPRKLDALENDRWNELPDATFTRALAQTVCRSLKIDPKPVLDLLPPAETMNLGASGGTINEPFRQAGGGDEGGWTGAAIRPLVVAALLLLLAAMAIYVVPASWWGGGRSTPPDVPVVTTRPAAPPVAAAASASGAVVVLAMPEAASAPAAPTTEAARGETVFAAPGGAAAPESPSSPATPAAEPVAATPSGALQLRVAEASWIEVRDGDGRLLLSRTVQPGEAVGLDGVAPLRLVIGNAPATTLSFRGRTIDLGPHTRDSVARLELR
jgi:cytoskeleton protein RodZ